MRGEIQTPQLVGLINEYETVNRGAFLYWVYNGLFSFVPEKVGMGYSRWYSRDDAIAILSIVILYRGILHKDFLDAKSVGSYIREIIGAGSINMKSDGIIIWGFGERWRVDWEDKLLEAKELCSKGVYYFPLYRIWEYVDEQWDSLVVRGNE